MQMSNCHYSNLFTLVSGNITSIKHAFRIIVYLSWIQLVSLGISKHVQQKKDTINVPMKSCVGHGVDINSCIW